MAGLIMSAILTYVGGKVRCLKWSCNLEAKHGVKCGWKETTADDSVFHVYALCIKTSALTGNPHELNLQITPNEIKKVGFFCLLISTKTFDLTDNTFELDSMCF